HIQGLSAPKNDSHFERDAIADPAQGLVIYCTDCGELQVFRKSLDNMAGNMANQGLPIGNNYQGGVIVSYSATWWTRDTLLESFMDSVATPGNQTAGSPWGCYEPSYRG
ncbi:MAG: hypothetical protein IPF68_11430, partial [Bacteroidales bacterium]|nr:hypothetical protein [Bacteroidales bacterium]